MATADEEKEKPDKTNVEVGGGGEDESEKETVYEFSDLKKAKGSRTSGNIELILDIPLVISAELGRTKMVINDLLRLGQGSVIEFAKPAGETLEIMANQRLIAKGEVVVMNEKYGIRITEIISPMERVEGLK